MSKCPWCGGSGVDHNVTVTHAESCALCKGTRYISDELHTAYFLIREQILLTERGNYRKHCNVVRRLEQLRYDVLHKEQ